MSDLEPELLATFNRFLVRQQREYAEKRKLDERRREDRMRAWGTASTVRLSPVQSLDVDLDVARLCVDSAGRLVIATTPGETWEHLVHRRRRAGLGLDTPTEIDYSVLDVELRDEVGIVDRLRLRDVPSRRTQVETLPGGGFLMVASRTTFGGSHNVWIVDVDGTPRHSFSAGDAISQVSVTRSGRIWTGYFDEGVFGDESGLGRSGLVCWSQDGECLYEFEAPAGCDPISDCYSMSVSGEDVWTCYDGDFPVVRVNGDFQAEGWPLGARSARAVAASGGRAAVASRDFEDGAVAVSVVDTTSADGAPKLFRLAMPDGSDLPERTHMFGRGRYINVVAAEQWLRLDVDDVPSS